MFSIPPTPHDSSNSIILAKHVISMQRYQMRPSLTLDFSCSPALKMDLET